VVVAAITNSLKLMQKSRACDSDLIWPEGARKTNLTER